MSRNKRQSFAYLLAIFLAAAPAVRAAGIDDTGQPLNLFQVRPAKPVEFQQRKLTLDDLIERSPMPSQFLQPIPLRGVTVSGLHPKSVETLGNNYFIVVDNTDFLRMSDVYRYSRLNGKSNFVTADSIIHPYLAFSNRILADAAITGLRPDLRSVLAAMQTVALKDYKEADDEEVRSDIEHNIAYLAVAMRLLDARYEMPRVGMVPEMVDKEIENIYAGRIATSAIFDGQQDFSLFNPVGWYNDNEDLQNFYRCRQWLSCVPFAVNDYSTSGSAHGGNMFRRSVLLFRSLDQAYILGRPAIDTWAKVVRGMSVYGSTIESLHERTLYPPDYKTVFADQAADLKVTLQSLAEPLFRTKLMLAVRRQKPNALAATSIFEMGDTDAGGDSRGVFRLFPMIGEPELPWMRGIARLFPSDKQASASWPVALLDEYVWGAPQAGNVLADNISVLDPKIVQVLPELQRSVLRRGPGGQLLSVDSRPWKILSQMFKPLPDGVPGVLRSDMWYSRKLMSGFAGWVDAQCAIASPMPDTRSPGAANEMPNAGNGSRAPVAEANTSESMGPVATTADTAQQPRRVSKTPPYHYLEPNADVYRRLEADATRIEVELERGGYFPQKYKPRLADFIRLFQRLERIAELELHGQQISVIDRRLLADIDLVLSKVDTPLPAVLPFDAGRPANGSEGLDRGFNLAVGRPGLLYVIYQNPRTMEWTLGRGAVYTYYEMPAPLLTASMWQHKLEAGFAKPPLWSQRWEIVQQAKQHPVSLQAMH